MQHHPEQAIRRYWQKIWEPMDMWLFYSMLAIYVMSLFLLYSADGQSIGQLENKTLHTVLGLVLLWGIARTRPQVCECRGREVPQAGVTSAALGTLA